MEISKDATLRDVVIQGVTVQLAAPFAEGHTCTANEANVLNQILAENIRNNTSKKVREMNEAAEGETAAVEAVQAVVDEYVAVYEFGVRRSGGGGGRVSLTPEEKFLRAESRKAIRAALSTAGHKVSEIETSEINRLADEALETNADFRKRLVSQFKQSQATAEALGSLSLPAETAPAE